MSLVFQNIDPPPPSPPGECVPPAFVAGGRTHSLGGERGGGSIFWKTPGTALYSTYVSRYFVGQTVQTLWRKCVLVFYLESFRKLSQCFRENRYFLPRNAAIFWQHQNNFVLKMFKYLPLEFKNNVKSQQQQHSNFVAGISRNSGCLGISKLQFLTRNNNFFQL